MDRRRVLKHTAHAGAAMLAGPHFAMFATAAEADSKHKFSVDLVGGAIGVQANQTELIELAIKHGFGSVQPNAGYLAGLSPQQVQTTNARLDDAGLRWGAASLPVEFRNDLATFNGDMAKFPKLAAALQQSGVTRISTWLKPFHPSLTWLANFKQHVTRIRQICKVASDHGLRFGLEYVGTKSLWTRERHSFIHTMAETKELISEVNVDNLGFVLDSWHWYTAGETAADIKTLTNKDVVACDLNDAPKGIAVADQIDNQRELPVATGVIDVKSFLNALVEIGYDGPVRAEPFNKPLNALNNDDACAATSKAIKSAFQLIGK